VLSHICNDRRIDPFAPFGLVQLDVIREDGGLSRTKKACRDIGLFEDFDNLFAVCNAKAIGDPLSVYGVGASFSLLRALRVDCANRSLPSLLVTREKVFMSQHSPEEDCMKELP